MHKIEVRRSGIPRGSTFHSKNAVNGAIEFLERFIDTTSEARSVDEGDAQVFPTINPVDCAAIEGQIVSRSWAFAKEEIFGFAGIEFDIPINTVLFADLQQFLQTL